MRNSYLLIMLCSIALVTVDSAGAEEPQPLRTQVDKVNYGIGVETARNYKNLGIEMNLDLVMKGLKDGLSGNLLIPEKELRRIITSIHSEQRRKLAKSKALASMQNYSSAASRLK